MPGQKKTDGGSKKQNSKWIFDRTNGLSAVLTISGAALFCLSIAGLLLAPGRTAGSLIFRIGIAVVLAAAVFILSEGIFRTFRRGNAGTGDPAENKMKGLVSIIENIGRNRPFRETLHYIYDTFSKYIPYTHIGVALLDSDGCTIRASYGVSSPQHAGLSKKLIGYGTDIAATSLGRILKTGEPRVINDLQAYLSGRKSVAYYNRVLLEEGIRSSISFPLKNNGIPFGILFFSSSRRYSYRPEHLDFLSVLANSIALSIEKDVLADDMIVSSTLALATLAEERDPETGEHLQRMKQYSRLLAELMEKETRYSQTVDFDFVTSIERFSPLHDIGKVAIRDSILLKPGRLTPAEFEIMKTHTTYGANVLRLADRNLKRMGRSVFTMGIQIAESHHERWDGTGYPHGLKGKEIPLSARIVAVADVLDALTSRRVYKDAYPFDRAVSMMLAQSGKHFDPDIMAVFEKNIDKFRNFRMRAGRKAPLLPENVPCIS